MSRILFFLLSFIFLTPHLSLKARAEGYVVIDAGHGGEDFGTVHSKIHEKTLTLILAHKLQAELKKLKIQSGMTRMTDTTLPLDLRAQKANQLALGKKKAVFVSIHVNAANTLASGIETFLLNTSTNESASRLADLENGQKFHINHATLDLILTDLTTTANFSDSSELACQIHSAILDSAKQAKTPLKSRGIQQALFYVLMQTKMPGVLFEAGFASNPDDQKRLKDTKHQALLAQAMAKGIQRYLSAGAKTLCIPGHPALFKKG